MGEPEPAPSGTVLVVEDERRLARLYTMWLTDRHDVRTAHDGYEAVDELDPDIDVALLDRRIPGLTGDQVLERIHEADYDCQVAMVTGVTPTLDIADLPIDEYLLKPVDRTELEDTVTELLLRQRADVEKGELLALLSRKRTLDDQLSRAELDDHPTYDRLTDRIERAKERLDGEVGTLSGTGTIESCPECGLRWDIHVADVAGFVEIGARVIKCLRCGEIVHKPDPTDRGVI